MAPTERELIMNDALAITRQSIRNTVNFSGQINTNDTLGFLGVQGPDIEPLKSWITGETDINVGVTKVIYTLKRDFLGPVKPSSSVGSVAEIILTRSIPEMTQGRALIVVTRSVGAALNTNINPPAGSDTLESLGINTPALLTRFTQAVVEHPTRGVRVFRHIIDPADLAVVTSQSRVQDISSIIINKVKPQFE